MNKVVVFAGCWLFIFIFLSVRADADEGTIVRAEQAEQACRELSQEYLLETGLSLSRWRVETVHSSQGFAVEGLWQSGNGSYWVECNVGFGGSIDDVDITISKDTQ